MGILRKGMGIMEKEYPPSALEGLGMLWKRIEMLRKGIQECCRREYRNEDGKERREGR